MAAWHSVADQQWDFLFRSHSYRNSPCVNCSLASCASIQYNTGRTRPSFVTYNERTRHGNSHPGDEYAAISDDRTRSLVSVQSSYLQKEKGVAVMGIFLGQLPPAEVARLKAELAETLIANFCYPRFFDNRIETLRMRPVDRAKRQEVWLFLSSVDFTSWSRVDLTSADFEHQIERLFIQFVQRNRAFFGDQGRRRMSDVRMLINSS